MLGALFFVGEHLFAQADIFGFVARTRTATGDRAVFDIALFYADQYPRRGADDVGDFGPAFGSGLFQSEAEEVHIRRGIDDAQRAVDGEGVDLRLDLEAL